MIRKLDNGRLTRGYQKKVSDKFNEDLHTVETIWTRYLRGEDIGTRQRNGSQSWNQRLEAHIESDLQTIEHKDRTTITSLEENLKIPRSKTHYEIKRGLIKRVTNHIKPSLTDKQKKQGLTSVLIVLT